MLINIEPSETVLETDAAVTVSPSEAPTNVEEYGDVGVMAGKKEYSIVGDALFASVNAEETPPWLSAIIGNVIGNALNAATTDMRIANDNIIQAISEISLARNAYEEYINIEATIDGIVASRVAQLNANIESQFSSVNADVTRLDTLKVSETRAVAIAAEQIQASLTTPGGDLYGRFTNLQTIVTSLEDTTANNYDIINNVIDAQAIVYAQNFSRLEAEINSSAGSLSGDITRIDSILLIQDGILQENSSDIEDARITIGDISTDLGNINTDLGTVSNTVGELTTTINDHKQFIIDQDAENLAFSQSIATMNSTVGDISATIDQEMTTFATDTGQAGAKLKINIKTIGSDPNNPNSPKVPVIGGFEMTGLNGTASAGFDVDTFWLGRADAGGVYPFIVDSDTQTVFMNNAIIKNLSVDKLTGIGDSFLIDSVSGKIRARYLEVQQIDLTDYVTTDDISNFATKDGTYTGNLATSGGPDNNTRMTITNSSIKVWNNGVLRVQIGDLTA